MEPTSIITLLWSFFGYYVGNDFYNYYKLNSIDDKLSIIERNTIRNNDDKILNKNKI